MCRHNKFLSILGCFTALFAFASVGTHAANWNTKGTSLYSDGGNAALTAPSESGYSKHIAYAKGHKKHNFTLLSDPKKARRGEKYQRVELRPGDCFPSGGSWNDCEMDRERFEFSSHPRLKPSGKQCFAYSLMLSPDFQSVHPTNTDLGQVHQIGGPKGTAGGLKSFPPLIQIGAKGGRLVFKWHKLTGSASNVVDSTVERHLANLDDMKSKWTDISFCLDIDGKRIDGWVNGKKAFEINESPINFVPKEIYFKYGIYRSFISRYKASKGKLPTQVVFYDEIRRGTSIEKVDFTLNPKLKPVD
jgi:hypothetical protein